MKRWELLTWAGVLLTCLLVGLGIGRWAAPEPVVGVIRFDATIDVGTATPLIELLEAARQDPQVAAVVMEITSPGGLATSSESLYYSMLQLRAAKPLVVVIDGLAVSGGYYMAAAANKIYAAASAYVGNIGTRGPRPDDPMITPDELSSGPYKLAGGSRFDRIYQLDLVADTFVNDVITQRQQAPNPLKLDKRTVEEARIYLGSEALGVGLVDEEGSRTDAILGAAELAGLRRYRVVDLPGFLGMSTTTSLPQAEYSAAVRSMVETAPPDAVFLLDSRILLPGLENGFDVERHLLELRGLRPASAPAGPPPALDAPTPQPEAAPAQPGEGS